MIVNASLNAQRSLLGYTTLTKDDTYLGDDKVVIESVYESYLVETSSRGAKPYNFNLSTEKYQRLQFLYGDQGNTS